MEVNRGGGGGAGGHAVRCPDSADGSIHDFPQCLREAGENKEVLLYMFR